MDKFLSNYDLEELTPNCKIVTNDQVKYNNTIEELFEDYDIVYLLYPWYPGTQIGHWTVLTKYNNRICYFDSYGHDLDYHAKKSKQFYVTQLLLNAFDDYDIQYNSIPLQSSNKDIATCGYYCVLWAKNYQEFNEIDEFSDAIIHNANEANMTPDQYVFIKISMLLKK